MAGALRQAQGERVRGCPSTGSGRAGSGVPFDRLRVNGGGALRRCSGRTDSPQPIPSGFPSGWERRWGRLGGALRQAQGERVRGGPSTGSGRTEGVGGKALRRCSGRAECPQPTPSGFPPGWERRWGPLAGALRQAQGERRAFDGGPSTGSGRAGSGGPFDAAQGERTPRSESPLGSRLDGNDGGGLWRGPFDRLRASGFGGALRQAQGERVRGRPSTGSGRTGSGVPFDRLRANGFGGALRQAQGERVRGCPSTGSGRTGSGVPFDRLRANGGGALRQAQGERRGCPSTGSG